MGVVGWEGKQTTSSDGTSPSQKCRAEEKEHEGIENVTALLRQGSRLGSNVESVLSKNKG